MKTQISLCIGRSEPSLIACAVYSIWAIPRRINKNPCYIGWIYRLIWVFCWSHRSYCSFCHALAQISKFCGCNSILSRVTYYTCIYLLQGWAAKTEVSIVRGSLTPCSFSAATRNLYSWFSFRLSTSYVVPRTNLLHGSQIPVFRSCFSTI